MQRRQVVREPDGVVKCVVSERRAPLRLDGVDVRAGALALKPMVFSVNVPLAATASFELLGFRPAPAREPPCEPFFCTFDLFLFGNAELIMEQQTNGFCGFVSELRIFAFDRRRG